MCASRRARGLTQRALATVMVLSAPALAGLPEVIFVNTSLTTAADDGTSWADAFRTTQGGRTALQRALDRAVAGQAIWVAAGTYAPAPPGGARDASFLLESGGALHGGFVGGEVSLDDRVEGQVTILIGDLNGNDGPEFENALENAFHVVTSSNAGSSAVLEGFTITGGIAGGSGANDDGGGMYNLGGSPTITNCTFQENFAEGQGGRRVQRKRGGFGQLQSHRAGRCCRARYQRQRRSAVRRFRQR